MINKIKIRVNNDLSGHKKGHEFYVDTDQDGTPLSAFWRNRIEDAKFDNCITILEDVNFIPPEELAKDAD